MGGNMKICRVCKIEKPMSDYALSRIKKHDWICGECLSQRTKEKRITMSITREEIKCRCCKKVKPNSEYYHGNLVRYDNTCKKCLGVIRSKYAKENRGKINLRNTLKRKRILTKWLEYFKNKGQDKCSQCGYDECFWAIEFHHEDKKDFAIKRFYNQKVCTKDNINKLEKELKKCIVLCANCHREEHYKIEASK